MTVFSKQFALAPRFCKDKYRAGICAGVVAILGDIDEAGMANASSPDFLFFVIFLGVVGLFTFVAIFSQGGVSWVLYVFLIPFWAAFPMASLGVKTGATFLAIYIIGFPLIKLWLAKTQKGKTLADQWAVGSLTGEGKFAGGGASAKW